MLISTLGLDIGGANLKAAHGDGTARSMPFALWKHPERLGEELAKLRAAMPAHNLVAVTMTGELCDCFETKRDGVRAILRAVVAIAAETPIRVWSTKDRFLSVQEAMAEPHAVAAANWLALAHYVADQIRADNVLLIDSGSTTTDIVYLDHGVPQPRGRNDRDRLASGELVYTGVRRTPISSVLGASVAAELFATMLDAYLLADLTAEDEPDRDTADGRPATKVAAHGRLARMLCADAETCPLPDAAELAQQALQTQWLAVSAAIDRVLTARAPVSRVVVSGSGEILGQSVAALHPLLSRIALSSLAEMLGSRLSQAACAYAVAILATQE